MACALNPSVNLLECKVDTTYVIILQGILISLGKIFPTTPKAHHNSFYLNWMVDIQVLQHPQLIFPSKTWFFGIYLNFQWQKSIKNQYLPHSESKSYQINSIKSCSSRSFQQHQWHIPIPPNFQLWWKDHSIFKNFCTASPNVMEWSPCTPPCWGLSKDTKNTIWSILVRWIS